MVKINEKYIVFDNDTRYFICTGGRGSGKSQFFADLIIIECLKRPGLRVLACREIQKSLKQSAKRYGLAI